MPAHAEKLSSTSTLEYTKPVSGSSSPTRCSVELQSAAPKGAQASSTSGSFSSAVAASYDADHLNSWQVAAAPPLADSMPGLDTNVWDQLKNTVAPTYPRLANNISADVVVVGGGIAGLSIAYDLVRAGENHCIRAPFFVRIPVQSIIQ